MPEAQFHVSHPLAGTLQQPGGVIEHSAMEEADIRVGAEGIDVTKRRIVDARGGMAVVQQLPNIGAAIAHPFEPRPDKPSQLVVGRGKPALNAGVAPNGAREPEEFAHPGTPLTPPRARPPAPDARHWQASSHKPPATDARHR